MCFKAFALTGRIADCLIPRALPWAKSFCPFRACCCGLLGLLGVAAYMGILPFLGVLLIWASWFFGRSAVGFWTFRACCCGLLPPLPLLYPSACDFQFRYALVTVGSGRAAVGLLDLRPYLKPANFKRIIQKKRENDGNLRK